jgi:hypothetical protein
MKANCKDPAKAAVKTIDANTRDFERSTQVVSLLLLTTAEITFR